MRISDWSSDVCSSDLGQALHAVAGIGNPRRFFNTLETLHWRPIPHGFADHAQYSAQALNFTPSLPVVMTEKDAVKCRSEEPTSELQSLMRISYAVFCLKKKSSTSSYDKKTQQYK